MKRAISSRDDVQQIVHSFYDKVRVDETLGPIFNHIITNWPEHLEKLTDFWEANLFGGRKYKGNPIEAHAIADDKADNVISAYHFGAWLNLWFETIDATFEGENADMLKRRARKMQTVLMIAIFNNRNKM